MSSLHMATAVAHVRSQSAASVLQGDAAICVMVLVEFSRPHNSHKVSCHLGNGLPQWLALMLIHSCAADGGLAMPLCDHVRFLESSLSMVDLRVGPHLAI